VEGEVHLRITAKGSPDETAPLLDGVEREIRSRLGDHVFGTDDDTLEGAVGRLLAERNRTVAAGESCTAGLLAYRLTAVPGSSRYFLMGVCAYSNEAKVTHLGVDPDLLRRHGAVSEEVAGAMGRGARRAGRADYGVGITGIAGPSGGTPLKPVGTVFIGVSGPGGDVVRRCLLSGDRRLIRWRASQTALSMLRYALLRESADGEGSGA